LGEGGEEGVGAEAGAHWDLANAASYFLILRLALALAQIAKNPLARSATLRGEVVGVPMAVHRYSKQEQEQDEEL
jgi:hypothetical protein